VGTKRALEWEEILSRINLLRLAYGFSWQQLEQNGILSRGNAERLAEISAGGTRDHFVLTRREFDGLVILFGMEIGHLVSESSESEAALHRSLKRGLARRETHRGRRQSSRMPSRSGQRRGSKPASCAL
jgi:hypothetical protein